MGLKIIVFVDKPVNNKQSNIIKTLNENQFPVLVDAVNGSSEKYLKENFLEGSRFFFVSDFISFCKSDEFDIVKPDFVVSFNNDDEISEKDWVCISRYFETLFFSTPHPHTITERGKELLAVFTVNTPILLPPAEQKPEFNEHYDVRKLVIPEKDTCLIQVEKPFCELPYTVVIRNFQQKGVLSFFTDLFICDSWGVSRKDYEFLQQVWNHWEMEGDLDLDRRLHEATQRCFPREGEQPEKEPEVYRRSIEEVLQLFQDREEGKQRYQKEMDFWNMKRIEKRKREEDLLK